MQTQADDVSNGPSSSSSGDPDAMDTSNSPAADDKNKKADVKLEDFFPSDEDDDDEFPSSAPTNGAAGAHTGSSSPIPAVAYALPFLQVPYGQN